MNTENVIVSLTRDLEEVSNDNEFKQKLIENLTSKLEVLHQMLAAAEKVKANETELSIKLEAIKADKRALENKHVKTCSEMKELKNKKEELTKENNSLKVSLKSSRKELKDASKHFEKEKYESENKIKNLQDYKTSKNLGR